jgi:tRNA(His) 5'-end guanylyltransferase
MEIKKKLLLNKICNNIYLSKELIEIIKGYLFDDIVKRMVRLRKREIYNLLNSSKIYSGYICNNNGNNIYEYWYFIIDNIDNKTCQRTINGIISNRLHLSNIFCSKCGNLLVCSEGVSLQNVCKCNNDYKILVD